MYQNFSKHTSYQYESDYKICFIYFFELLCETIQFKIICIALLRYTRCKLALQEIHFLQ